MRLRIAYWATCDFPICMVLLDTAHETGILKQIIDCVQFVSAKGGNLAKTSEKGNFKGEYDFSVAVCFLRLLLRSGFVCE